MNIQRNENVGIVTHRNFEYQFVGDIACANSKGASYERIDYLTLFTFKKDCKSRRRFKVLCKKSEALINEL
ncbi:MAG: hypothetical protein GY738_04615 [Pseudoalteromonas sp.]|nr:hypothetical protein [Pseudoalteromonas sp.]